MKCAICSEFIIIYSFKQKYIHSKFYSRISNFSAFFFQKSVYISSIRLASFYVVTCGRIDRPDVLDDDYMCYVFISIQMHLIMTAIRQQ